MLRAPTALAVAAAAALTLGACGGSRAPAGAPGVDLTGAQAWYEFDARSGGARTLLRGSDLGAGDWHRSVRLTVEATQAETAAFEAGTTVGPKGVVAMRAPRGALVHLLTLGPEDDALEVTALIDTDGLTGRLEDGYARLSVFEVDRADWPGSARALVPHIVAEHACDPILEDTDGPVAVGVRLRRDPAARALAVTLELVHEGEAGPVRASFAALRVSAVGAATAALELAEDVLDPPGPEERPRLARWAVDLVHRPGWALPPGARLVLPMDGDRGGRRVSMQLAAVGADRDARWTARLAWSGEDGGVSALATTSFDLVDDGDPETATAGWRRFECTLPQAADLAGALVVTVDGVGRDDTAAPTLALIASPRLEAEIAPRAPARPNLLVVSLDTVRADHLGAYGGDPRLSANFDALAARGAVFLDAWSTAPYTLPAHVSLFSGQLPTVHGVQRPSQRRDRARTPMLAELMGAAGYRTAAFTGGAMVLPRFGFAAGFERYGVLDPAINDESTHLLALLAGLPGVGERAFAATGLPAIEAQLDEFGTEPWFLFVHTYAAHEFDPPRRHLAAIEALDGLPADDPDIRLYLANAQPPPPPILERIKQLYAGGVRQADELLGELVARLERRGLADNTVIVVVSDHGKELGDHGIVGHGHVLYDELVRVPLVFAGPGVPERRSNAPAQLTDVLPTLTALFDLPAPEAMQGRDLLSATPPAPDRELWAEVDGLERLRALRRGPLKTILDRGDPPGALHFDLARDPAERTPLPVDPAALERLEAFAAALEALHAELPSEGLTASVLDAGDRAQLEALGYLVDEDGSFVDR